MLLLIDSFAHFLVDALCAATLFGPAAATGDIALLILVYNTLAFSTQCLVGLAADHFGGHPYSAAFSMLLVILGFVLPLPALLRVILVGLGNSVFHVAGGAMTLLESNGRAGKLGVFVAPGCIGLTLGTLYPNAGYVFAVLLLICAVAVIPASIKFLAAEHELKLSSEKHSLPLLAPLLLTCSVMVRAIGGSAVSFPWNTSDLFTIIMTLCIFAGKTAGGYVCDSLGVKRASLLSVPVAAVLIAFCSKFMLPSLIGQFALNLTMPITLWLLYKAMPDSPAFAFGLAASALWPGTIIGKLLTLTGPALWFCVLLSFVFGLCAILYSNKKLLKE